MIGKCGIGIIYHVLQAYLMIKDSFHHLEVTLQQSVVLLFLMFNHQMRDGIVVWQLMNMEW